MENKAIKVVEHCSFFSTFGHWTVRCYEKTFMINNNGIKLIARKDEGLKQIHFNLDDKTITVIIENSKLPAKPPRTLDLSDDLSFFEEVRKDIDKILLTGTYSSVTSNPERTIFDIS